MMIAFGQQGGLVISTTVTSNTNKILTWSFLCGTLSVVCVGFLWVLEVLPTVQGHAT